MLCWWLLPKVVLENNEGDDSLVHMIFSFSVVVLLEPTREINDSGG